MISKLNNHPVLDKGHVIHLSSSNEGKSLSFIQSTFLNDSIDLELLHMASITFVIKMPLFVQLHMSRYNLTMIQSKRLKEIETYIPDIVDIGGNSTEEAINIHDSMGQTAEALTLNTKGYIMDGCDEFVAQAQSSISVYNELVVHGSLYEWLNFIKQGNLPKPIEAYRYVIENIISAEWKNIDKLKKMR